MPMFREAFLGRNPSHFHLNPFVKAYILSESSMWAAWNFITPIFAVFVVQKIAGGTIETAAFGYSLFLLVRVVLELISGRVLQGSNDKRKVLLAVVGMICIGIAYLGFAMTETKLMLFYFYALLGVGIGIAMPAKNALFSMYLDKNKEASEWSISDAMQFTSMAIATAIGGYIALHYGFSVLFYLAFFLNIFAILPYAQFFFIRKSGTK